MEHSGGRSGNQRSRPSAGGRSASADSLVREVRWQLFRRDELPARLRRLQRLEEVADATPHRNGAAPENQPDGR